MAIVVSSDFWSNSYSFIRDKSSLRKKIAQLLNYPSMRKDRELITELLGAAAGEAALAQLKRVAHSTSELGGVRSVETVDLVNRVTAAADDTDITTAYLTYNSTTNAYPADRADSP